MYNIKLFNIRKVNVTKYDRSIHFNMDKAEWNFCITKEEVKGKSRKIAEDYIKFYFEEKVIKNNTFCFRVFYDGFSCKYIDIWMKKTSDLKIGEIR